MFLHAGKTVNVMEQRIGRRAKSEIRMKKSSRQRVQMRKKKKKRKSRFAGV
jgi:hypothetical protein